MSEREQRPGDQAQRQRRGFLRGMAAAPVAAAVAATPIAAQAAAEPTGGESTSAGYRVTQHVLDYYKTLKA